MSDIVINPPRRQASIVVAGRGPAGPGVPVGGAAGQVLAKTSGADYATGWIDQGAGGSTAWADITGKPTFATVATTGAYGDLSGLPALFSGAYGDLTGIPATFAPSAHGHAQADVTGLVAALAGKADAVHGHAIADVTGLQVALDGKQPLSAVLTNTTASFTTADETKLDGIATGATANATDAALRDRATHTGTQTASTISDFAAAVAATAAVTANTAKVTNATHTGDVTGATALTLATVNSNVGAFGSATQVATFTVNAKGLTTAAGNTPISVPATAISDSTAAGRAVVTAANATAQTALFDLFTTSAKGLAPASGGGTTNFLRADGTWAAPAGGGGGGASPIISWVI